MYVRQQQQQCRYAVHAFKDIKPKEMMLKTSTIILLQQISMSAKASKICRLTGRQVVGRLGQLDKFIDG